MIADWIKEWAIPLSAGATFLLALAAFWVIWQNRGIQIKNRKERLLNEIIKWAEDVAKCGLEMEGAVLLATPDAGYAKIKQMALTFSALFRESRRITNIVLPSWDKLHETIEELRKQLPLQGKYLETYMKNSNNSTYKAVEGHRDTINSIADKVIDEATKIKTRDIG